MFKDVKSVVKCVYAMSGSVVGVRFLDVVLGLAVLLVKKVAEVFCGEGDDVGGVLLNNCLGVVFKDVGQLLGHYDLLRAVNALLANVRHCVT